MCGIVCAVVLCLYYRQADKIPVSPLTRLLTVIWLLLSAYLTYASTARRQEADEENQGAECEGAGGDSTTAESGWSEALYAQGINAISSPLRKRQAPTFRKTN